MTANKRAAIHATNDFFPTTQTTIPVYRKDTLPPLSRLRLDVNTTYDPDWRWTKDEAYHNKLIQELNRQLSRHHVICAGVARMHDIALVKEGHIQTVWDLIVCDEDTILPRPASDLVSHCYLAPIASCIDNAYHPHTRAAVPPLEDSLNVDEGEYKMLISRPVTKTLEQNWQDALNQKAAQIREAVDTNPLWVGFARPTLNTTFTPIRANLKFYAYTRYPIPPWYSHADTLDALGLTTHSYKKAEEKFVQPPVKAEVGDARVEVLAR
ncbi:MAG: hypothetical protein SPI14_06340 [Arcanobacterium sp.]|nr:hypothetical protein [Arcanobacterium sp.]